MGGSGALGCTKYSREPGSTHKTVQQGRVRRCAHAGTTRGQDGHGRPGPGTAQTWAGPAQAPAYRSRPGIRAAVATADATYGAIRDYALKATRISSNRNLPQ